MGRNRSGVNRAIHKFVSMGMRLEMPGRVGHALNPYKLWNCDAATHAFLAHEADHHQMDAVMGVSKR